MFKDKLELEIKGEVTFSYIDASGVYRKVTRKNAIQSHALEIVAKNLISHPTAIIDVIEVYNGVTLLSSKPIINKYITTIVNMGFDALFDGPSFSGPFTEIRLKASGIGYFSIINSIVDSKLITDSLLISWAIQLTQC